MILSVAFAGEIEAKPEKKTKKSAGTAGSQAANTTSGRMPPAFNLLPKSLQSDPMLDMTVFTEMTEQGRSAPSASADQPIYYVAQPEGFRQLGASVGGEKPPPAGHMDHFVRKALASAGYHPPPSADVRPSVLVRYRWGTHNVLGEQVSSDFPDFADDDALERARLVGGKKLAAEMARTMESGEMITDQDVKRDYLKAQAFDDLYFVVISAYEYDGSVRGQPRLLWRTNMTVNAAGVSVRESLGPLIASAAPFLGRDMAAPEITAKRVSRREKIEIGEATVIEFSYTDPVEPPPAEGK